MTRHQDSDRWVKQPEGYVLLPPVDACPECAWAWLAEDRTLWLHTYMPGIIKCECATAENFAHSEWHCLVCDVFFAEGCVDTDLWLDPPIGAIRRAL